MRLPDVLDRIRSGHNATVRRWALDLARRRIRIRVKMRLRDDAWAEWREIGGEG